MLRRLSAGRGHRVHLDELLLILSLGWTDSAPQTSNGFVISDARIWRTEDYSTPHEVLPNVQVWLDKLHDQLEQYSIDFDPEEHNSSWDVLALHAAEVSVPSDLYSPIWPATKAFFRALDGGHSAIYGAQGSDADKVDATDAEAFGWESAMLTDAIARVSVPGFIGQDPGTVAEFAKAGRAVLSDYQENASCGWVVDLRRNWGGNMWGMLLGLQPLLGEGAIGAFVDRHGERQRWLLTPSSASIEDEEVARVGPAGITASDAPVAMLIGRGTVSSGEAIAAAFWGRPSTRFFGAETYGFADSIESFKLPDGAELTLATARFTDRTGRVFGRQIAPDEISDKPQEDAVRWLTETCAE